MFKTLGLLFIFIVVAFVVLILGLIAKVMSIGRNGRSNNSNSQHGGSTNNGERGDNYQKEFSKNEGEYVDFEEIKDNEKNS